MIIDLHNVRARVTQATDAEHEWLADYLSWPDGQAVFRRRRGYRGDGYIRLYNRVDNTYPAGFTRILVQAAKKAGHAVQVFDNRHLPCTAGDMLPLPAGLRDYQVNACHAAVRRTRGVIWAATASGKTQIAMGLVESVPIRWLFLVNQTQLGHQARDRYKQFIGEPAGVIAEGEWSPDPGDHSLTVATFQTLYSRLKKRGSNEELDALAFLSKVQGIIVDECHVLPADSFRRVLDFTTNAYYRIGLSATPLQRGDRKSMHLIGCLGSVIYRVSAKTLVDAGILAKPIIKFAQHNESSDKKTWQGAYNEIIVRSKQRNALVCQLAQTAAKPCVVFVKALEQGQIVTKALTKAGHTVEYVDGSTPTPVRQAMVKRLERGDTDILVSTVVMNQGIDIPELRSVVIAAGGSSAIAALQRVGRGMRKVPGKEEFEVHDIQDTGNKWTERWTKERVRAYGVEEYEVTGYET